MTRHQNPNPRKPAETTAERRTSAFGQTVSHLDDAEAAAFNACLLGSVLDRPWVDDGEGRAASDPAEAIRSLLHDLDLTQVQLTELVGPQWRELLALLNRAAHLDDTAVSHLALVREQPVYPGRPLMHAWLNSYGSAAISGRDRERDAIWEVVPEVTRGWTIESAMVQGSALEATLGAAAALGVRDLVDLPNMLTQADYDLLTRAWATVVGPVHLNDSDRLGESI